MLKFEWPLILPGDPDIEKVSKATFDLSEYVVDIARNEGLAPGMEPIADGGIALHISCHSRAQNMGPKAREMLKLIPNADIQVIERCSGHGGSWGYKHANFNTAMKVGKPAARQAATSGKAVITSECPLAGLHIAPRNRKPGRRQATSRRASDRNHCGCLRSRQMSRMKLDLSAGIWSTP